jgi:hypothetical protein
MEQAYSAKSFDAYRAAFAPVRRVQQEGLNAIRRLTRFQYTLATDFLEHNLAGVQAMVSAATPTEYLAKQGELYAHFIGKLATHTQEFLKESTVRNAPEVTDARIPELTDKSIVQDTNDLALLAAPQEEETEEGETKVAELLEAGENTPYQAAAEEATIVRPTSKTTSATTKQGRRRSEKPSR